MINIGQVNRLVVNSKVDAGFYLYDKELENKIFMPISMSPISLNINDEIDTFVYLNTSGDQIATSEIPFAVVGEFAFLDVVEVQDFGAFLDWGIEKDLLVPGNEQKIKLKRYEKHLVRICLEEGTDRIYGTTKLGKYIEGAQFDIKAGDKVDILPVAKTDLGYKIIINKKYIGMIYHNEIYKPIVIEEKMGGFVKGIREDGLVDVTLQVQGVKKLSGNKEKLLEYLSKKGGQISLHDKSDPYDIKVALGMSKKAFKGAVGMLYKEKKIVIKEDGIELRKK